jgi:DNA-binding response OmpR family regulator
MPAVIASEDIPLVLVVEDEALIGMTLLPDLEEAGYRVVGPFTRGDEALRWIERNGPPDLAILDIVLGDGPCQALARELRRRRVGFLVFSGHDRGPDAPEEFWGAPWIEKPGSFEALRSALEGLDRLRPTAVRPAA